MSVHYQLVIVTILMVGLILLVAHDLGKTDKAILAALDAHAKVR